MTLPVQSKIIVADRCFHCWKRERPYKVQEMQLWRSITHPHRALRCSWTSHLGTSWKERKKVKWVKLDERKVEVNTRLNQPHTVAYQNTVRVRIIHIIFYFILFNIITHPQQFRAGTHKKLNINLLKSGTIQDLVAKHRGRWKLLLQPLFFF